ncbi:ABC transporter permease [Schaalia vaccimaxillae]|uniref:ABC transporter permease n=1 Tax=Schaalia vaccimaxillae TaxID=183916 RepID=UPI0003B386B4|nr:ABC transporter permease [Schaalia vaccimaxillae]
MSRGHSSGARISPTQRLTAIWDNRRILWLLVKRDLKVRYADSILGYVWSVLDPLVMGLIYWFVFTIIFHRSVGQEPYIIFLLTTLLPWLWFQITLTDGTKSITTQQRLVRSTAIPREIWVLRSVCARGIEFLLSLPVLVIFCVFYRPDLNAYLWLFPVGALMQFLLLTGLCFITAPLMVILKDIEPLVRMATRFLFYASPIIYGIGDVIGNERMPELIQSLYLLNPLAGIFTAFRAGLFPTELDWTAIGVGAVICVLTFIAGCVFFARTERAFLKEI